VPVSARPHPVSRRPRSSESRLPGLPADPEVRHPPHARSCSSSSRR
jgi:hypothetical protein